MNWPQAMCSLAILSASKKTVPFCHIHATYFPVKNAQGSVFKVVKLADDVTEDIIKKQARLQN